MAEYINRGTAIAKLTALEVTEPNATMADAKRVLADIPAADVAPVVHGRWVEKWGLYDKGFYISRKVWYECSNCGMKTHCRDECFEKEVDYNYCPDCGAKMDGAE